MNDNLLFCHLQIHQTSATAERSGVGRGHKGPMRGGGAGRGRNNRQNGGPGYQSEGTSRGMLP